MRRRVGLNEVGAYALDRMDGTRPISRIADEVADEFGVPGDVALSDTLAFVEKLRGYGIVDAATPAGRTLRSLAVYLLVLFGPGPKRRALPRLPRRRADIRGGSFVRILMGVFPLVLRKLLPAAGLLAGILGWFILAATGGVRDAVLVAVGASLTLVLGVGLHEAAHLYAVRRFAGDPDLGYVKTGALRISVVYPNLRPESNFWVALSGPLCPTVCGVALYCLNAFHGDPLIATSALVLVAHTISYVPVPGSDGMNLLSHAAAQRSGPAGGTPDETTRRTNEKEQR